MPDVNVLSTARSFSLMLCAIVFVMAFTVILYAHWLHHRQTTQAHHRSLVAEMGWSLTPMLMVLAVVGVTFKDFWLV